MNLLDVNISGTSLLTFLIFSPLLGVLALAIIPAAEEKAVRLAAIFSGTLTLLLAVGLLANYPRGASGFHFGERLPWLGVIGASYILGIDGMSLWLVVLTALLTWLVLIASTGVQQRLRSYLSCLLLLEVGMLGALCALDGLLFYVFWEVMLIPMYFLIGVWGGKRRVYAAIKFVLFTASGSLLMLVAIAYLGYAHYRQFGYPSFYLGDWLELQLSYREELWTFLAFALAFAIKIPVFPLHTWLPDAHVEAPTGGSVILAGVLLKMGLYGLIRFCLPVFPVLSVQSAPVFAVLGVIGIVFGALVAWVQTDIKKLVAYSSVSHLGFCVLGYAALNLYGLQGSLLQMINHGVSTAALFLIVGVLYDRKHSREISDYQGLGQKVPRFAVIFLLFTLSSIGLPLTNGFVGEFLVLLGGFGYNRALTAIAVSGVVLGAMYMLSLYRRVVFGPFNSEQNHDLSDLTPLEMVVFLPLVVLVFLIGLYPRPILSDLEPVAKSALHSLHVPTRALGRASQRMAQPEGKVLRGVTFSTAIKGSEQGL